MSEPLTDAELRHDILVCALADAASATRQHIGSLLRDLDVYLRTTGPATPKLMRAPKIRGYEQRTRADIATLTRRAEMADEMGIEIERGGA